MSLQHDGESTMF